MFNFQKHIGDTATLFVLLFLCLSQLFQLDLFINYDRFRFRKIEKNTFLWLIWLKSQGLKWKYILRCIRFCFPLTTTNRLSRVFVTGLVRDGRHVGSQRWSRSFCLNDFWRLQHVFFLQRTETVTEEIKGAGYSTTTWNVTCRVFSRCMINNHDAPLIIHKNAVS